MPPTYANGKICYIELPATDIASSADFYKKVFGWNVRTRSNGSVAFDDTVGEVSGSWIKGRPPHTTVGLIFYIMVDDCAATVELIKANGGEIVQPIGAPGSPERAALARAGVEADAPEITARFRDPGGNVIGLYQQPQ